METIVVLLSLVAAINGLTYDVDNKTWIDFDSKYTPPNTLIIGGSPAAVGLAPYQASLRIASSAHICGGSILNSRWLLTASHCVIDTNPITYAVVGTNKLNTGGKNYTIKLRIRHESYNKTTIQNDIALLKTTIDIVFSTLVKAVVLPTKDVIAGQTITVTGWGKTVASSNALPNDLQVTYAVVLSEADCKAKMSALGVQSYIFPTTLCTYKLGTGVCNGDSGGPLVINGVQYGVVSWNINYNGNTCNKNYPDASTRVLQYISWISSTQYANRFA